MCIEQFDFIDEKMESNNELTAMELKDMTGETLMY